MIQVDREIEPQILVANREAWTAEYVNWSRDPADTRTTTIRTPGHSVGA